MSLCCSNVSAFIVFTLVTQYENLPITGGLLLYGMDSKFGLIIIMCVCSSEDQSLFILRYTVFRGKTKKLDLLFVAGLQSEGFVDLVPVRH